jgi:serine/threonine-protein kinase HipA
VSFAYDPAWLSDAAAFALDPRTQLFSGDQSFGADSLPPSLYDTTPDAWGQMLLTREAGRLLGAWELLTRVSDETRMGALRLAEGPDGPFVRDGEPAVPPMTSLRELQALARSVEEDPDAEIPAERLRDLVVPGSSLGGARPKANVRDASGALWIAKFPSREDRRLDIGAWEYVFANLAERAGIAVAERQLLAVNGPGRGRTYLARRFDRGPGDARRLYVSAMSLTDHRDGEPASYPDIAQAISRFGAVGRVKQDLEQLFRRLLFNVLAGNRDDHLRNHGFLRYEEGWRLSPAFDMNPARAAHPHSLSFDGRTDAQDIGTAMTTHRLYALTDRDARRILGEVIEAVEAWQDEAVRADIGPGERRIVSTSFSALEDGRAFLAP